MQKKIKILFVLPTLGAGGAQRILSFLAQNVDKDIFESHLLIIGKATKAAYTFDKANTTFLNKNRVLSGIPTIIKFLVKNKPDVVISSIGHLNTVFGLLAPFFRSCKFIIREASVISVIGKFVKGKKIYGLLSKIAYKNIDAVVCQSADMANDFMQLYAMNDEKVIIISNPITEAFPIKNKVKTKGITKFITVGRFSEEKGHARLLELVAKISYPFHYTLIGSGPEMVNIKNKIEELELTEKITHIPFTANISQELREHDIFLQGSYVEGFPNAVLESLVVGTPVLAFVAPGGTKEIIEEGINGFIVENENEFLDKLETMLTTKWNPNTISVSVKKKYNKERILSDYENLFLKLHAK